MPAEIQHTGGLPVCRPEPLAWEKGGSQGLRKMSDLHIGAASVDYRLIDREVKDALSRGDRISLGGDLFDVVMPSNRRKSTPQVLHRRLQGRNDLMNELVTWAEEILAPAADLIDVIGDGNHDLWAEHDHHMDLIRGLVEALQRHRDPALTPIQRAGMTAFVEYRIADPRHRTAARYVEWYHHQANPRASNAYAALRSLKEKSGVFAADLYWTGHVHARGHSTEVMIHCGRDGRAVSRDVKCLVTGSYLVAYGNQTQESIKKDGRKTNYAANNAVNPGALGGARVVLYWGDKPGFPERVEVVQ